RHYVDRVVRAIAPAHGDAMVEIGPGTGILTRELSAHLAHLDVVEIDRDLASALRREFPDGKVSVHQADALEFDFASLAGALAVRVSRLGPPGACTAPPNVDSAVVRMEPLAAGRARAKDEALFARVVAASFEQRRKMLRSALRSLVKPEAFEAAGIDAARRGE